MTSSARFDERSVESIRHELEVNLLSSLMLGPPIAHVRRGRQPWGKAIHPLVTYAVSGMGRVRSDYTELVPDATVTEGLAIQGEEVRQAGDEVNSGAARSISYRH